MNELTTKLNKSAYYQEVYAKNDKQYGVCARTYSNKTQAQKFADKVNGRVWTPPGRMFPFYVIPGDN